MSVLDAYRLLYKENGGAKPPKPQCQRSADARGKDKGEGSGKSFDKLMKPGEGRGKTPTQGDVRAQRKRVDDDDTVCDDQRQAARATACQP